MCCPPKQFWCALRKTVFSFLIVTVPLFVALCVYRAEPSTAAEKRALLAVIIVGSFWLLVLVIGPWKSGAVPTLIQYLRDNAWAKSKSREVPNGNCEGEKKKEKAKFYGEKVRSMNLATSIIAIAITFLLLLIHEEGKQHGAGLPAFYEFLRDLAYFAGLVALSLMLLSAEMLDTAANIFVGEEGHEGQRFFYSEALRYGGAGFYYFSHAGFALVLVLVFSIILRETWATWLVLIVIAFGYIIVGSAYFFGYYQISPDGKGKVTLKRETGADGKVVTLDGKIYWGVVVGWLLSIVIFWVLFFVCPNALLGVCNYLRG